MVSYKIWSIRRNMRDVESTVGIKRLTYPKINDPWEQLTRSQKLKTAEVSCFLGLAVSIKKKKKKKSYNRAGFRMISEGGGGVDLIQLLFLLYIFEKTGLSNQCWPRSNAAERGVWSGSTLFATHPAVLQKQSVSKMDLLKRSIW